MFKADKQSLVYVPAVLNQSFYLFFNQKINFHEKKVAKIHSGSTDRFCSYP